MLLDLILLETIWKTGLFFFLKNAPEDFPRFLLIPSNFTMETKKPRSLYLGVMKTWRNTKIIFIFFHS